jgi:hypothetical protein
MIQPRLNGPSTTWLTEGRSAVTAVLFLRGISESREYQVKSTSHLVHVQLVAVWAPLVFFVVVFMSPCTQVVHGRLLQSRCTRSVWFE